MLVSTGLQFNFLTAWNISVKLGSLVHHAHGYKRLPQTFTFCPETYGLSKSKKWGKENIDALSRPTLQSISMATP